jgi:hypothetical protein
LLLQGDNTFLEEKLFCFAGFLLADFVKQGINTMESILSSWI